MSLKPTPAAQGRSQTHDSAPLHVTGAARFIDDMPLPANALHLAFGLSEIAHGRILSLDLAPVRAAEGVVAVWGPDELGEIPDCSPSVEDEPLIAKDAWVHYLGQPLFFVAATSHLAARKAARLAKVSYEAHQPILTVDEALAAGSRFESGPIIWEKGDAQAAIAAAPYQLDGVFNVGGQEHFYLEGQIACAIPQDNGDMVIHSSTQHPSEIQHKVAHALHLPMHAVRVEVRRMGGGFGGKESQGNALAIACAIAAQATGVAVKMRYDRDDDMMITGKRHDLRIHYRVGFDQSGRIHGVDFTHLLRCGWAQDLSLPVADRAMLHADNCYDLPAIRIESHRLRTHTQSATAFRGFGGPQGMVGIERLMSHVASHLGMDPLALRQRNFYASANTVSALPEAERPTTPYEMPVEDFIADELTEALAVEARYHERRAEIAAWNAQSPVLKRGIALSPVKFGISFTLTHLNQAGALVHVYQDGSVSLNHGGTEMGQGLYQKVAQVVAEVFGLDTGHVRITATDTSKVPNTSATAASSGSDLNGMAARNAALAIRERLSEVAAAKFGCTRAEIHFEGGQVQGAGQSLSFAELAQIAYNARVSLSSTGFYATPKIVWDRKAGRGRPFFYFAYGASLTEVVIDTLTGENRILRTDIIHDSGRSLNPALDIGQIEGGYVQGAGWLTMEELVWDAKGALRTHAPSTYKIPACSDRPKVFNVRLWDRPNNEDSVGRSKAVGEPPFMLGISAHLALADAVAAVADPSKPAPWPDLQAPATAEEILRAVARVQAHV